MRLSVFTYNIPAWQVRQRKNKIKQQEHRSFIDWFIAVPAKITISGHQIESTIAKANKNKQFSEQLRMYSLSRVLGNIIFIKPTGRSLIFRQAQYNAGSSKRHKNKERKQI